MKSRKVTIVKLEEQKEGSLSIFGIASAEPDYKLSLLINRKMGLSLRNTSPLIIPCDKEETHFSRFLFTNTLSGTTYSLIHNKADSCFLFRQIRNIDYIFVVNDPENKADTDIMVALRNTESVTGVFRLNTEIIKDRNFLFI